MQGKTANRRTRQYRRAWGGLALGQGKTEVRGAGTTADRVPTAYRLAAGAAAPAARVAARCVGQATNPAATLPRRYPAKPHRVPVHFAPTAIVGAPSLSPAAAKYLRRRHRSATVRRPTASRLAIDWAAQPPRPPTSRTFSMDFRSRCPDGRLTHAAPSVNVAFPLFLPLRPSGNRPRVHTDARQKLM